jgi:hypothetical protein
VSLAFSPAPNHFTWDAMRISSKLLFIRPHESVSLAFSPELKHFTGHGMSISSKFLFIRPKESVPGFFPNAQAVRLAWHDHFIQVSFHPAQRECPWLFPNAQAVRLAWHEHFIQVAFQVRESRSWTFSIS